MVPKKTQRSHPLLLIVSIIGMFFASDLSVASASPDEQPADPNWNELQTPLRVARRRRRRRRGRKHRRRRPPRKAKPRSVTPRPAPTASATPRGSAPAAAGPASGALRRGARVEFDGRLVQGQTAKSGAIYLFARKRSELRSMVKERVHYRKEILRTVYTAADR